MSRKKKPLPLLENVEIETLAAEGKSLFHWDELVVFVPFCVPGDIVDVQLRRKKHNYAEGVVTRFIKYSNVRAIPRCEHFGVCGGCTWQNLPYDAQLRMKQKQVFDQLSRIGKLHLPWISPIMGSVKQWEYRNKLEYGASCKRWMTKEEIERCEEIKHRDAIGFHITGAFDKILPIRKCHLMDDLHNVIRNEIERYAIEKGISFYDLRQQTGLLRDMVIRNSNTNEWMFIIQFCGVTPENVLLARDGQKQTKGMSENDLRACDLLQHIVDKFPQVTSLLFVDNRKSNDTYADLPMHFFAGKDHIIEAMEDLRFKVGPKSFYQTNTEQAYHLYCVARDFTFSDVEGSRFEEPDYFERREEYYAQRRDLPQEQKPLVYDLYTGTGTIANFVAKNARQVIGIEYVPEAIEDAKINSQLNHIDNTLFFAGDMKDVLSDEFIAEHGRPDIIITDPPRAGMHPDVVRTILRAAPQRIVYVSCNPATQARDLALMDEMYQVKAIQPVDMFPHTPHVEKVVVLVQREDFEVNEESVKDHVVMDE